MRDQRMGGEFGALEMSEDQPLAKSGADISAEICGFGTGAFMGSLEDVTSLNANEAGVSRRQIARRLPRSLPIYPVLLLGLLMAPVVVDVQV
jgi:hypothetical protein